MARASLSAAHTLSRLDRLLLLLDTGSSAYVRTTAAKQIAQLAAKSVISDVALVEDDVKTARQHVPVGDPAGWSELMAVVARVSTTCYYSLDLFLTLDRYSHIYTQDLTKRDRPHPPRSRRSSR